ncbi:RDD family protein [Streptomyces sp. Z26]|uniref:RDD family protein n=1 Tax=Streptomyces sp. Z26 TaxID=2500177 RepID=UPI000EF14875|nr:RDD family protein [Streptomyces sp. Z26]RLL67091.1 RDD family protein [Streptomyces sp. Z26]
MSTEQPSGDPFRKPPPAQQSQPPPGQAPGGSPYGEPPPGGGSPYGSGAPYGTGPYGSGAGPYGGSPYGGSPYGGGAQPAPGDPYGASPYGHAGGAADPLAGMPPLAPLGKRVVARLIDALIVGIPLGLVMGLLTGFSYDDNRAAFWQGSLYTVVYFLYEGVMLSQSGQTVGKKVMNIRVAMLHDGSVPTGSPAWTRAAVYQLPTLVPCIGSLFWLVNVLSCTWDQPYRRCFHDKAAKTVAVTAG